MDNDRRNVRRTGAGTGDGRGMSRSRSAGSGSAGRPGSGGRKRFHGDEVYSGTSFGTARARNIARRKRQRMRRRMTLCGFILLIFLAVGGMFFLAFRGGGEKEELLRAGIASMETGNYDAAIASFEQELELANGKIGAVEREVLLYRAEAEYRLEDYTAALHTYELLLEEDPDNAIYRKGAAMAMAETGDFEGALDLHAADAMVYSRMAKARIEAGQYEEAQQFLNQAEAALAAEGQANPTDQANPTNTEGQSNPTNQSNPANQSNPVNQSDLTTEASGIWREITFNQAVLLEYQGDFAGALKQLENYVQTYGSDEEAEREIMFLKTRQGNY